jgi:broad specificity phosphatase PhoE
MGSRVVVVQHAEKVREPGDPGLTEQGRHQALVTARFVADRFAPFAVWASPLRRAVETANPLAEALGCGVRVDARLRERMNWEGDQVQTLEDFLSEWNRTTNDRSFIPVTGDSSERAAARFIDAITQIVEDRESGDTVAVVAHGGVTVDTLRTIAGDAQIRGRRPELVANGVPCGATTVLERDDDTWRLVQLPSVEHLDATVEHRPV